MHRVYPKAVLWRMWSGVMKKQARATGQRGDEMLYGTYARAGMLLHFWPKTG